MSFPRTNFFLIGGFRSPGKATLVDATKVFGWDQRKGYGLTGAYSVPTGEELVLAKFLIELWDGDDWPLWLAFSKKFFTKPVITVPGGLSSLGLGILHPVLNAPPYNVHKVVPARISTMIQDEYGLWSCTVELLEFKPPAPAPARPLATIPDVAAPQPTAQDAADREIAARGAELAALAGP